jgi:hypothetical protein
LKRGPNPIYGDEVFQVVKAIWLSSDQMCSKRLKAAIPLWLPYYERKQAPWSPEIRKKVLTFTDIYSGWTENRAMWNRGAHGVIEQIRDVESDLVFPLLGFDCDNGAEFLNHHLLRYLAERPQPVKFTRGRPYPSNDNAHVEQKHWTHVRQLLGYDRLYCHSRMFLAGIHGSHTRSEWIPANHLRE